MRDEEFARLSFLDRAWFKIRDYPIGSISLTYEERQALIKNIQEIEEDLLQIRNLTEALSAEVKQQPREEKLDANDPNVFLQDDGPATFGEDG